MNRSRKSLRKDVERLLSSGKYLIRGDREGRIDLGEARGTWATNDLDNALFYGDEISVVAKPKKTLQSEIDDAFARYVDKSFGKEKWLCRRDSGRVGKATGRPSERWVCQTELFGKSWDIMSLKKRIFLRVKGSFLSRSLN